MPRRGLLVLSHGALGSYMLPFESRREVTGEGTGQRCSDSFFEEDRLV